MLLERLEGDVEAVDQLLGRELGLRVLAAAVEQVGQQCLEDGEALGMDGRGRPLDRVLLGLRAALGGECVRCALVPLAHELQCPRDLFPQLVGRLRHRAAVLAQDPRGEQRQARVLGHEDAALDLRAEGALDPPGRVAGDFDPRLPGGVADLPRRAAAVAVDVELGRQPEVSLAARGEADLAADARNAERALVLGVEVEPDDVPGAAVLEERVGVDGALALLVARDRPVRELDRALLRDRCLELPEPALHLDRVLGVEHLDAQRGIGGRLGEALAAEREVLQREPQRLRVGELALEQVEAGLQRRELVVGQLERRQEVALGAHVVELLARVLVALRMERDAERDQLGAVGVETTGERLVRHLLVALDLALDVARGHRPPLRHQEGDERELTDQLVRVVRHPKRAYRVRGVSAKRPHGQSPRGLQWSAPPSRRLRRRLSTARGAGATGSSRGRAAACAGRACPCASSPGSGRCRRRRRRPRSGSR